MNEKLDSRKGSPCYSRAGEHPCCEVASVCSFVLGLFQDYDITCVSGKGCITHNHDQVIINVCALLTSEEQKWSPMPVINKISCVRRAAGSSRVLFTGPGFLMYLGSLGKKIPFVAPWRDKKQADGFKEKRRLLFTLLRFCLWLPFLSITLSGFVLRAMLALLYR